MVTIAGKTITTSSVKQAVSNIFNKPSATTGGVGGGGGGGRAGPSPTVKYQDIRAQKLLPPGVYGPAEPPGLPKGPPRPTPTPGGGGGGGGGGVYTPESTPLPLPGSTPETPTPSATIFVRPPKEGTPTLPPKVIPVGKLYTEEEKPSGFAMVEIRDPQTGEILRLTPSQLAAYEKSKAIYEKLGVKQPSIFEEARFRGIQQPKAPGAKPITPDEIAYYSAVERGEIVPPPARVVSRATTEQAQVLSTPTLVEGRPETQATVPIGLTEVTFTGDTANKILQDIYFKTEYAKIVGTSVKDFGEAIIRGGTRFGFERKITPIEYILDKSGLEVSKYTDQIQKLEENISTREQERTFLITGGAAAAQFVPVVGPAVDVYFLGKGVEMITKGVKAGGPAGAAEVTLGGLMVLPGIKTIKEFGVKEVSLLKADTAKIEVQPSVFAPRDIEYSRQRATFLPEVINEQEKSLGIILGKSKQGEYISLGGKIEKGETPLQAALREAREETGGIKGLKPGEIKELKALDVYGTPEETQQIYTGKITLETYKRLEPTSDIKEFKLFKPEEFEKVLGPSGLAPRKVYSGPLYKQLFGVSDEVRITEAVMLGRFKEVKTIGETISKLSPGEREALSFTAREALEKKFGKERLKGYSNEQYIRDYFLLEKKKLPEIAYVKTPRGKLYLQMQSRYDIAGESQAKYFKDALDKKTYAYYNKKFEGEVLDIGGNIEKAQGKIEISKYTGRKEYRRPQLLVSGTFKELELTKGELAIEPKLSKRGGAGFYFQPPIKPGGAGYVGLSYVLGGKTEYKFSILPKTARPKILYTKSVLDTTTLNLANKLIKEGKSTRQIQAELNKAMPPGEIGATAKTVTGAEAEVAAREASFELSKKTFVSIEGKPVELIRLRRLRGTRLTETQELYSKLKKSTSASQRRTIAEQIRIKTGLSPSDFESINPNVKNINIAEALLQGRKEIRPRAKETIVSTPEEIELSRLTPKRPEPTVYFEKQKEIPTSFETEIPIPTETEKEISRYIYPRIVPGEPPPEPPKIFPNIPPLPPSRIYGEYERRKKAKKGAIPAYTVSVKRRGRYVPIAAGLPRGIALQTLSKQLRSELARTGRITKAGITEREDIPFMPSETIFRQYRVRKGKRVPTADEFIQRTTANLQTIEEKALIKAARGMR